MTSKPFSEQELEEILEMAQEGENKLRQMSDYATIMAEKWRRKTNAHPSPLTKP